MVILSLFDGISCGYLALKRAGIPVTNYYASEVDKYAIACSSENNPEIILVGDINLISYSSGVLKDAFGKTFKTKIDLVIGGSPCQSFSAAGNGSGFNGKSGLYYQYSRVLKEVLRENPKALFLLENVVMRKEWSDIISKDLCVEPILIDSGLVSVQRRKRLYWTNIPNVSLPLDKKLSFDQYFDPNLMGMVSFPAQIVGRRVNAEGKREDYNKDIPIEQYVEVRLTDKANTLTTVLKDNIVCYRNQLPFNGSTRLPFKDVKHTRYWRYLTPEEYEDFQTIPRGYTKNIPKTQRYKTVGNAWTVDVIAHIFKHI